MLAHGQGRRLEQAGAHVLAAAGALSLAQRRHDADDAAHAAEDVDNGGAGPERPVRQAGHEGEPAHHLGDLVERPAFLVGPAEEALELTIDEARVERRRVGVTEAEPVHGAEREILDHHVGLADQRLDRRPAFGRFQVDGEAPLVAAVHAEEAGPGAGEMARAIAGRRRLELQHISSEIGQEHAAGRSHDRVAELQNRDIRQRQPVFRRGHMGPFPLRRQSGRQLTARAGDWRANPINRDCPHFSKRRTEIGGDRRFTICPYVYVNVK